EYRYRANHTRTVHTYPVSERIGGAYVDNSRVQDPNIIVMIHKLVKSKPPFKQIYTYVVESSGTKDVTRQDMRNLIINVLKDEKVGSVEARVEQILNEFVSNNPWNASRISVDDGGTARCLTIQTAGMRKMFDLFPEILMLDTTDKPTI
ncbi:hypothetical protein PHMEG_0009783, partial [Phytophthora megakarya]